MTDKLIEYRTVSSPKQANKAIEQYENMYHCKYSWGDSYGKIEEAIAVCVIETEHNCNRYVTTTSKMSYINNRRTAKTFEDIGEL